MTSTPVTFGARAAAAMAQRGPLCAGLDPHPELLKQWGLSDDVDGLRAFSEGVVEAWAGHVALIKPQSAFFERHGPAGMQVLVEALAEIRRRGTLAIVDAKRGDIGSSMAAYAQAHLGPGAAMEADALTVSPYLGFESLRPAIDLARQHGRGLFVLMLTSNPEGAQVQTAGSPTVAARLATAVAAENGDADPAGHVGVVIGATGDRAPAHDGVDLPQLNGYILSPGLGAQGAQPHDLTARFAGARDRVIPAASRALLSQGPGRSQLRASAQSWNLELASALGR